MLFISKRVTLVRRTLIMCFIIVMSEFQNHGPWAGFMVHAYAPLSSITRVRRGQYQPPTARFLVREYDALSNKGNYDGSRSSALKSTFYEDGTMMLDSTETLIQNPFLETTVTYALSPFVKIMEELLNPTLHSPVFWSAVCVVSVILLLYGWKSSLDTARRSLPETLQPVVNIILLEMAGLGYVSLLLNALVTEGPGAAAIADWSQTFLGNSDLLWKCYQVVDASCLKVSSTFFALSAFTVTSVVRQVDSIETVSRASFDVDGDGEVELSEIAQVLDVDSLIVDLDGDGEITKEEISIALQRIPRMPFWTELTRTEKVAQAETLVIRERLVRKSGIDENGGESTFSVEKYFIKIFAQNLGHMVELSPLVWLMMVPLVAQGRSIDLSNDIAGALEANAFVSSGEFISSPGYFAASVLFSTLATVWGVWNFWKLVKIKNMLVPILVRDTATESKAAVLLPPRYEDDKQMETFNSSPFPFNLVESIWGEPARNRQEALFGAAGREGPHLYLQSIKLQIWFTVAQLIFYLNQIVVRDAAAVFEGAVSLAGRPDMVLPELALYGFICCLGLGQLWLVPKTFLVYNLVTSIETLISEDILTEACELDDSCESDEDDQDKEALRQPIKRDSDISLSPVTSLQTNATEAIAARTA